MNMRNCIKTAAFALCGVLLAACNEENTREEFWLGADLGWLTEYESTGHRFYEHDAREMECTALMKQLGLNAVRHRVWVDPSKHGNWCSKEDMSEKCIRARDLDIEILLDFH